MFNKLVFDLNNAITYLKKSLKSLDESMSTKNSQEMNILFEIF
jgi:hypothetical protein